MERCGGPSECVCVWPQMQVALRCGRAEGERPLQLRPWWWAAESERAASTSKMILKLKVRVEFQHVSAFWYWMKNATAALMWDRCMMGASYNGFHCVSALYWNSMGFVKTTTSGKITHYLQLWMPENLNIIYTLQTLSELVGTWGLCVPLWTPTQTLHQHALIALSQSRLTWECLVSVGQA